jgi:hypothetical protein
MISHKDNEVKMTQTKEEQIRKLINGLTTYIHRLNNGMEHQSFRALIKDLELDYMTAQSYGILDLNNELFKTFSNHSLAKGDKQQDVSKKGSSVFSNSSQEGNDKKPKIWTAMDIRKVKTTKITTGYTEFTYDVSDYKEFVSLEDYQKLKERIKKIIYDWNPETENKFGVKERWLDGCYGEILKELRE